MFDRKWESERLVMGETSEVCGFIFLDYRMF